MKDKILLGLLAVTLVYSVLYKVVLEDLLIENVKEDNIELFDEVSNIEPIGVQMDADDTAVPEFNDEDQELIDKADYLIYEATGGYYEAFFFSLILFFGLLFYFLARFTS